MDDPHRRPGARDRDPLVARIRRAADQGRIGTADRDIRLGNVASAQSMAELDLMCRELDQLEAALPTGSPAAPAPASAPTGTPVAEEIGDLAADAARTTLRSIPLVTVLVIALVLAGAGATAYFASRGPSGTTVGNGLQDPLPITPEESTQVPSGTEPVPLPGSAYALTGPGIRAFLKLYRERFHTSQVVDLTMYDDYVIVDVPAGKARHEGWLYRKDTGFTPFGQATTNFPGAQPVDTDRLAVPALVRNIARARSTLQVEHPTTTYVIVRDYASVDAAPSVDIHVANAFNESGYLATALDGTVGRSYPFAQ